ncbi:putative Vacuolar protein sorting-associated protein 33B, partial [Hypsibius exemplaris]
MAANSQSEGKGPLPDFSLFRTVAKTQLIHLLESLPEPKDLVLDDDLMRPLDRIVGASEHGVSCIYKLEKGKLLNGAPHRLYLFRPSVKNTAMIAAQIRADHAADKQRTYRLVMTPRRSAFCEKILEREGLYGSVTFDEFPLEFLALDDDILSMEHGLFFKDFFV